MPTPSPTGPNRKLYCLLIVFAGALLDFDDETPRRPPRVRAAISSKCEITPLASTGTPAGTLRSATCLRLYSTTTTEERANLSTKPGAARRTRARSQTVFSCSGQRVSPAASDTPNGKYMGQAREYGFPADGFVSLMERKIVVDWLRLSLSALDSIIPLCGASLSWLASLLPVGSRYEESTTGLTATFCLPPSTRTVGFDFTCTNIDIYSRLLSWRCRDDLVAF
ncbi:hypothetical protein EI94DRAFT_1812644 [Lactarius quietus]|nr:hypothetical protein EI94DRAFT_1812644 [Lactarius quietus]